MTRFGPFPVLIPRILVRRAGPIARTGLRRRRPPLPRSVAARRGEDRRPPGAPHPGGEDRPRACQRDLPQRWRRPPRAALPLDRRWSPGSSRGDLAWVVRPGRADRRFCHRPAARQHPRRNLGSGACRGLREGDRRGGLLPEEERASRTGGQHRADAALRAQLRLLRRGPLAQRPDCGRLRSRNPGRGHRGLREAFCPQQPGKEPGPRRRGGRRAGAARDLPARVRGER